MGVIALGALGLGLFFFLIPAVAILSAGFCWLMVQWFVERPSRILGRSFGGSEEIKEKVVSIVKPTYIIYSVVDFLGFIISPQLRPFPAVTPLGYFQHWIYNAVYTASYRAHWDNWKLGQFDYSPFKAALVAYFTTGILFAVSLTAILTLYFIIKDAISRSSRI